MHTPTRNTSARTVSTDPSQESPIQILQRNCQHLDEDMSLAPADWEMPRENLSLSMRHITNTGTQK